MTYYSKFKIQERGRNPIEAGFNKKITLQQAKNIGNWCRMSNWNKVLITDLQTNEYYKQDWRDADWIKMSAGQA